MLIKMCKLLTFLFIVIGFIGCVPRSMADDTLDLYITKYKSWEPKSNNFSPDDIRCYCNLPRCVTTGYMCRTARSSDGGCFSEITNSSDILITRHGCIELLINDGHDLQCDKTSTKSSRQTSSTSPPNRLRVHCCYEDMCNHVDRPDYKKQQLNTTNNIDQVVLTPVHTIYSSEHRSEKQSQYPVQHSPGYNSEFWFKVATIAVPICGAVIIFVLVGLAIKLLKNDGADTPSKLSGSTTSNGNRKVALDFESYGAHVQNIKQLPFLKQNPAEYFNNQNVTHSELKNESLAKKNQLMTLEYSLLPQSCHDNKQTNTDSGSASLYRNVNLSLNPTNRCKDIIDSKVYEKEVLNPTPYWAGN